MIAGQGKNNPTHQPKSGQLIHVFSSESRKSHKDVLSLSLAFGFTLD